MLKITLFIMLMVTALSGLGGCSPIFSNQYNDLNPHQPKSEQPSNSSYPEKLSKKETKALLNKINNDPQFIFKLSPPQLASILGTPTIIKSDSSTEIWQFRGACTLDVVWSKKKNSSNKKNIGNLVANEVTSILNNTSTSNTPAVNYNMVWLSAFNLKTQPVSTVAFFNKLKRL